MPRIKVGVIPAAGKGRRIDDLPLTRVLPKPILPVLHRPLLEYVIDNLKSMGAKDVYLIVGPKKEIFREYFRDGHDFGVHINYIEQRNPHGIAHAIGLTREYINEPFVVILGDDLTIAESLDNLAGAFWDKHAMAVEGVVAEKDSEILKQTCCITLNGDGRISDIQEKPSTPSSNVRGCGVYIFDPIVYEYIRRTPRSPPRYEKEITNTIKLMIGEKRVYGVFLNGVNININRAADLSFATRLLLDPKSKP